MTRNEFIATTAARLVGTPCPIANTQPWVYTKQEATAEGIDLADHLESIGVAPWLTTPAAPALSDAVAVQWEDAALRVVDTGLAWERDPGSLDLTQAHIAAVRALRAARGGAP